MNNRKIAITTVVTGLVLTFGIWSANSLKMATSKNEALRSLPVVKVQGNHILFDSIEEVEKYADLIVVGKTTKDLEEGQPVVKRFPNGRIEDYYTLTSFEIKKVLKGSTDSNEIQVIQRAVTMNEAGQQYILMNEDYSLLKRNSPYVLFLAKVDGVGYGPISLNQGKFSLDKTDKEERKIEEKDSQYLNLKTQALKKYADRLVTP